MKIERRFLFLYPGIFLAFLGVHFYWFVADSPPLTAEHPLRILWGSLLIFVLPGLFWGEVLGFRSSHFLEAIALSLALTMTIEVFLLPVPFYLGARIGTWVMLLFLISAVGLFLSTWKIFRSGRSDFVFPSLALWKYPAPLNWSSLGILLVLIFMTYGTYRWGMDTDFELYSVPAEILLETIFIRKYFGAPMITDQLGLGPGIFPANFVHFWEYLLAAWARSVNLDPLPLIFRARFVIPVLGLSGLYLMTARIFIHRKKSEIIFWAVLMMCLGAFIFIPPNTLEWVWMRFRGLMIFMGTIHHGDSAMDILLALIIGLMIQAVRRFDWRNGLLVLGGMAATFLWHPREYFQTILYLGILGFTLVLFPLRRRKTALIRWAATFAVAASIGIFYYFVLHPSVSADFALQRETQAKSRVTERLLRPENLVGFRNIFNFPLTMLILEKYGSPEYERGLFSKEWNLSLFLVISAISALLLIFAGNKEERHLAYFYVLFWFLSLAWNFSMLVILYLTYTEFFMTTDRLLYIFSYPVIGAAFVKFTRMVFAKCADHLWGRVAPFSVMLLSGVLLWLWWRSGMILVGTGTAIITLGFVFSIFFIPFIPLKRILRERRWPAPDVFSIVLGIFLLTLPLFSANYVRSLGDIFLGKRPAVDWWGNGNHLRISGGLIGFIRSLPYSNILVDPLGGDAISIYAPHDLVIVPKKIYLHQLADIYRQAESMNHPLFKPTGKPYKIEDSQLVSYLKRHAVDYILLRGHYYDTLLDYFSRRLDLYKIVFQNSRDKEAVVKVLLKTGMTCPRVLSHFV